MLDSIKNFFGNMVLKSMIKAKKSKNQFMPFDKAKEIGIIYQLCEKK